MQVEGEIRTADRGKASSTRSPATASRAVVQTDSINPLDADFEDGPDIESEDDEGGMASSTVRLAACSEPKPHTLIHTYQFPSRGIVVTPLMRKSQLARQSSATSSSVPSLSSTPRVPSSPTLPPIPSDPSVDGSEDVSQPDSQQVTPSLDVVSCILLTPPSDAALRTRSSRYTLHTS